MGRAFANIAFTPAVKAILVYLARRYHPAGSWYPSAFEAEIVSWLSLAVEAGLLLEGEASRGDSPAKG